MSYLLVIAMWYWIKYNWVVMNISRVCLVLLKHFDWRTIFFLIIWTCFKIVKDPPIRSLLQIILFCNKDLIVGLYLLLNLDKISKSVSNKVESKWPVPHKWKWWGDIPLPLELLLASLSPFERLFLSHYLFLSLVISFLFGSGHSNSP